MPLLVESGVIRKGTHLPGLHRYNYDIDWSTNINPVTTAGGGLISVGVPVYPLVMDVFCTSGYPLTTQSTTSAKFSRNSANTTPAISQGQSWASGFDGDISAFLDTFGYILTPWKGQLLTQTSQVRAIRVNSYMVGRLPTCFISGYSWSK
jgi:hypothetical protein